MANPYGKHGKNDWSRLLKKYDPLKAGSIDGTDTEPHDHGVVRALEAEYFPDRNVKGDPQCTIFVSKLTKSITEKSLKKAFSHYGHINRCRIVRDIVTGATKGYGFIEFDEPSEAYLAYSKANNRLILDNVALFVDYECERLLPGWIPRRLGGGFCGKKESGQLRFGGRARPFKKPYTVSSPRRHEEEKHETKSK